MPRNTTATNATLVSTEVAVPALKRLAAKTSAYVLLATISAAAMGVAAFFVPWVAVRARIYALALGAGMASAALVQARKRLHVGRILGLAETGAQITMDGSEITATHNTATRTMLLDVKTSYAINFPPTDLKLPRAVVVD